MSFRQQQVLYLPQNTYEVYTVSPSFNLQAQVNSFITLHYQSTNNNIISVDSIGNVTINGPGTASIKVFNNGNFLWEPVEKLVLIRVSKKKQTINFFVIPNKYINEPNFSLSPYGFSTSGLPLKYKSLTPKIAQINENGYVTMYNPGTVSFEAVQEGNFEWEAANIIQDFGTSSPNYPFDIEFTSRNPNTLVKFNLYKNENNTFSNILNVSGGLYFGNTKYSLSKSLLLPTGEYIGVLNYDFIPSGEEEFILESFYSFSTGIFSGTKEDEYLSFKIDRSGFVDYALDIIVQGVFKKDGGYKYSSKAVLESGIFWSGSFPPNQKDLIFTIPLFYNNKEESNIAGDLEFTFINNADIPKSLTQNGTFDKATFVVASNSLSPTISQKGILPYSPKDLGVDFIDFRKASLDPTKYPKINE
jgi:hypothetical protein